MLWKARRLGVRAALLTSLLAGANGAAAQANAFTTPTDVEAGEQLFGRHCSRCHGIGATGGERGPDLTSGFRHASTDAGLFEVISEGIDGTGMRGIYRTRSDQSVWQIVAYLRYVTGGVRVEVDGDPAAGASVFRGEGGCADCHVVDGEGGRHGPDLSTVGDRRNPDQLRSDLVDPDARVQPEWWRMRVRHRDGTRVEGLRMNEGTYSVRILDQNDQLWSFEKRNLAESERIETSAMPSYADRLTERELQDLVAYLYGLTRDAGRGATR